MTSLAPLTFAEAVAMDPTPWRIEGDHVLDANGDLVTDFDGDCEWQRPFWAAIVVRVNAYGPMREALAGLIAAGQPQAWLLALKVQNDVGAEEWL